MIKSFEGLRLTAYQDIAGIWTIGYGHTGSDVIEYTSITEAQAEALLLDDVRKFETGILKAVTVTLGQNQFDALVSFAFNIGLRGFQRSTACRRLNASDYLGCAEAMLWWTRATINKQKKIIPGLVKQRAAEAALFLTDLPSTKMAS